ncbi:factor H binding family protein [Cardiobacteriaceae bacterium TAE3-ERU3]|nr:factor H binding family protein [Cardiobacteriaceae bacterium TAE3-ERU3]
MNKVLYISSIVSLSLLLSACGGSGGNNMVDQDHKSDKPQEIVDKTIIVTLNDPDREYDELVINHIVEINGHRFNMVDNKNLIDFSILKSGLSETDSLITIDEDDGDHYQIKDRVVSYNQFYSTVIATRELEEYKNGSLVSQDEQLAGIGVITGLPTPLDKLPAQGKATYRGIAFLNTNDAGTWHGNFNYTVDFGEKSGHGSYSLNNVRVTLDQGMLASADAIKDFSKGVLLNGDKTQVMFGGNVAVADQTVGRYMIGLYGPHAEEAAGAVKANSDDKWTVGLGGKRGEIVK